MICLLLYKGMDFHMKKPVIGVTPQWDDFETRLFTIGAIEMRKPTFGICRGLQVINVMMGGTLYQDIASQYDRQPQINHDQDPPHDVHSQKLFDAFVSAYRLNS